MKIWFALLAIVVAAGAAFGAMDLSGQWTGTFVPDNGSLSSVVMTFEQKGDTLTGSVSADGSDLGPIQNGKVSGNRVTFDVFRASAGITYRCDLTFDGGHLAGAVTAGPGITGKLDMTLSKPQ